MKSRTGFINVDGDWGTVYPTEIMLDIETLGNIAGQVVLEAGMVAYNLNYDLAMGSETVTIISSAHVLFNVDEQTKQGLSINPSTLSWWVADQERALQFAALLHQCSKEANPCYNLSEIRDWMGLVGVEDCELWTNGNMDTTMLRVLFEKFLFNEPPWKYGQVRDLRTLIYTADKCCCSESENMPQVGTAVVHRALNDAVDQANIHLGIHKLLTKKLQK